MPFHFKRKEPVTKGLKRLAAERIDAALHSLKDYQRASAVHGVRKDIKKVRAVLRLARDRIPKKVYRRQTDLLRKAADRLAPTRDAYVKGAALKNLGKRSQDPVVGSALRELKQQLDRDLVRVEKRFAKKARAREVKKLLKRLPRELECLRFDAKGWDTIAPGLKDAFSRGRKAYLMAREVPSPEHLHEWRKRVKDLWYQVRVLRPIHPEYLDGFASQLKTLSEDLGDDHDLFLLEQSVGTEVNHQQELLKPEVLHGMIEQRRRELQCAAFKLGQNLYEERPASFCARFARYWKAWRGGKDRVEVPPAAMALEMPRKSPSH